MEKNISNQKSDYKRKAVVSVILGFVSVIPATIVLLTGILICVKFLPPLTLATVIIATGVFTPISLIIAVLGIILGILGMKSTKKELAILGIILSLIGLGSSIYIASIATKMSQG